MRLLQNTGLKRIAKRTAALVIMFCFTGILLVAQEDPPKPITVETTAQNLAFGAFYHGPAGGTVSISSAGSRTSGGSVVLLGLGYSFSPALFYIRGNPGTIISLLNGPAIQLNGSGGGTLTLSLGLTDPVSPFVLTNPYPVPTELRVGGTLSVGSSGTNPPGSYNGTFEIIFNQQ